MFPETLSNNENDKNEDLYKDILKGKSINPEELISRIKAIAKQETDVNKFTEMLIDYVYSHSF
jgi:hypothetical protein